MMDENKESVIDAQQPEQPADLPEPREEKLFTQEEVNKIVSKRLAKIKASEAQQAELKTSAEDLAKREADLNARETKLSCREYVMTNGLPADLLEVLDTSDFKAFKEKAERLAETFSPGYPKLKDSGEVVKGSHTESEAIKRAFLERGKHKPKGY